MLAQPGPYADRGRLLPAIACSLVAGALALGVACDASAKPGPTPLASNSYSAAMYEICSGKPASRDSLDARMTRMGLTRTLECWELKDGSGRVRVCGDPANRACVVDYTPTAPKPMPEALLLSLKDKCRRFSLFGPGVVQYEFDGQPPAEAKGGSSVCSMTELVKVRLSDGAWIATTGIVSW
jgi:hypothetical protein